MDGRVLPIGSPVDEQIWTFARNGEQLEIRRAPAEDGVLLSVIGGGPSRTYFFAEVAKLESFQADFEKFLLGTGWLFVKYSPDRRSGRERRHFSRLLADRRRWWTDGLPEPLGRARPDDDRYRRVRRLRNRTR